MSRYGRGLGISTVSEDYNDREYETVITRPSWANEYEAALEKHCVKSRTEDQSLYDQINSIIGTKSKFSTVEEVVNDLKHRSGLAAFLAAKQASDEAEQLFHSTPALKTFIDNYIEAHPGTSVEAVIQAALKIPQLAESLPTADNFPTGVKEYINKKLADAAPEIESGEDMHLGKVDLQTDNQVIQDNSPLTSLSPAAKF